MTTRLIPKSEKRSPVTAAFGDRTTQFLAPPTAAKDAVASRASDCGEAAMHRLRHPFAVVATTVPRAKR